MADENKSPRGGDGEARGGTRRYFRRRKNTDKSGGASERNETEGKEGKAQEGRAGGGKPAESRGASSQSKATSRRRARRPRSSSGGGGGGGGSNSNTTPNSSQSNAGATASKPRSGGSSQSNESRRSGRSSRSDRSGRPERTDRQDNTRRSSRSRRRRRSASQEPPGAVQVVSESTIDAIEHEYAPPKAVFVYTHISRPSNQGMTDYRTEHFPRTGRTLEEFYVDISPLFDAEGNMLPPGTFRRVDEGVNEETFADGDWEEAND